MTGISKILAGVFFAIMLLIPTSLAFAHGGQKTQTQTQTQQEQDTAPLRQQSLSNQNHHETLMEETERKESTETISSEIEDPDPYNTRQTDPEPDPRPQGIETLFLYATIVSKNLEPLFVSASITGLEDDERAKAWVSINSRQDENIIVPFTFRDTDAVIGDEYTICIDDGIYNRCQSEYIINGQNNIVFDLKGK